MDLEWDETKRQWTIEHRNLDFADVVHFDMATAEHEMDRRRDYGEVRFVSTGYLHGRLDSAGRPVAGDLSEEGK